MSKPRRTSLGQKTLAALFAALALAFASYLLVYEAGVPWLLYGDGFAPLWEARMDAAVDAFQDYVDQNGLSSRDSAQIQAWQKEHPEVYLFLDDPFYAGDEPGGGPVTFSDATLYATAYVSDAYYGFAGRVLALGLAAAAFLLVMLPFLYHLLRRLSRLTREMELVTAGDLEHRIAVEGRDELSALGEHIDRLRQSVLDRIQREQDAVQANRALVSALSHDLRTPLTKQIGYLEILQRRLYANEAERREYQGRVWKKALQMKDLSDQLFQQVQVGGGEPGQDREVLPGNELLGQILEEQIYDLTSQGFLVEPPAFPSEFLLEVSPEDLLRIFDNLFSNLKKYAAPGLPIPITVRETEDEVCIRMENRVRPPTPGVESSRIGLNAVRALLERNHGRLDTRREGDRYCAEVTLTKYLRQNL